MLTRFAPLIARRCSSSNIMSAAPSSSSSSPSQQVVQLRKVKSAADIAFVTMLYNMPKIAKTLASDIDFTSTDLLEYLVEFYPDTSTGYLVESVSEKVSVGHVYSEVWDTVDVTGSSGYVLFVTHPKFWGRGYATSAVGEMIKREFKNSAVKRLRAKVAADDYASQKILERNGFKETELMDLRGTFAEPPVFIADADGSKDFELPNLNPHPASSVKPWACHYQEMEEDYIVPK